jgi:sugar phosphate isomerase/epimerase
MPQLKIGIQLASLKQPFKKALHTAARLGADAVEIDARTELRPAKITQTGAREIRKMLEDLNLRVAAIGFLTRRGYNVADDLDRRVAATKDAMKMAYELGASAVINHVGYIPPEPEGPQWTTLIEVLTDLGRHGQRVGATLSAQTGAESGEQLARLIDALPPGALGVNFDPGGLLMNGHSPREALERLAGHVLHVHARDAARDLARRRGIEVPLGRGSTDIPELLGRLEERGYRGYFTVVRERSDDPEFEIGQAVQFLRRSY